MGTWIDAVCFSTDHFEGFKDVMDKLKENTVVIILKYTKMLNKEPIKNELIKAHFFIFVNSIKKLEKVNLSLYDILNFVHIS